MNMKNLNKIKVNYLIYIILSIYAFCGRLKLFLMIFCSIILHECGHILFIKKFKGKINRIYINIFGGKVDYSVDKNIGVMKKFLINIGRNYFKFNYNFI